MIPLFRCEMWPKCTLKMEGKRAENVPFLVLLSSDIIQFLVLFFSFFHSLFSSSLFFFLSFSFQKPYNHLITNDLQSCLFSFFARFVFFKKYSFSFHFSCSSFLSGRLPFLFAAQKSPQYHSFSTVKGATFRLNNNSFEPQKC